MVALTKHINDIHNIFLRDSDGLVLNFTRAGEDMFYLSFYNHTHPGSICQNCGCAVFPGNEAEHRECKVSKFSSIETAQYIASYLSDYPDTLICINNGYEDQCYLKQKL